MDRLIFTAASGAGRAFTAQQVRANNLANVNTQGFRADMERAQAFALQGTGYDSRALVQAQSSGTNFTPAALQQTGRDLDVGIKGDGFFVVEMEDGQQAMTRAGHLERNEDGDVTLNGLALIGAGEEEVNIPLYSQIAFGQDGTISIVPDGEDLSVQIGQLKLVNPEPQDLIKLDNGLFMRRDQEMEPAAEDVAMVSGFLEQSNVVAVEEMIASMQLSRHFEVQLKMMQTAETLAEAGNRLIRA
ncbi:flagellar basal body rod protein FlgF [Thaumasiovibrio sp. DFM-14]|uniref:flagellar basal body rod protein FlgF n=1 Tax=Thaumasiovibrio sp. DFM-14 TaxID=3384792 RepID=UPI0039A0F394